jgi:hypothetical protein
VIRWRGHLGDRRLFDCCVAEQYGERLDPPIADHLADCLECRQRYAEMGEFLESLRTQADVETDLLCTPERLQGQQQEIARRIAHVAHGARVISFPARELRRAGHGPSRVGRRWVAAAAAAGLFVGVGVGIFLDRQTGRIPATVVAPARPAEPAAPPPSQVTPSLPLLADHGDDAIFMSELELALEQPNTPELSALDALTPHVREVSFRMR